MKLSDSLDPGAERRIDTQGPVSSHAARLMGTALDGRPLGSGSPAGGRFNSVPINSRGETARTSPNLQPAPHGRRLR